MSLIWIRAGSHRRALLLAMVTVAATVAAVVPAAASTTAAPLASSPPGDAQLVTLVTGDVVSVSTAPDGRQEAAVVHQANTGPGAVFQAFNLGSDLYVVPQSAVPDLGTTLDLSLFDVTKLAASAATSTTVQVTFRSAAAAPAVPGIKITRRSGTSARGVITPATAPKFGAALVRQWRAYHAAPTHNTGLFASVARISATTSAPQIASPASVRKIATPAFVMHTLTVKGRDLAGKKDTGDDVLVLNVDDTRAFAGDGVFSSGITKFSVPQGHYAAVSLFFDPSTNTLREVADWQFTVGGDTSIQLDERQATAPVTITTQKPATTKTIQVGFGRSDALGGLTSITEFEGGPLSIMVQPTTQPITTGQLHYFVSTERDAADGSYTYNLEFHSDGAVLADEHYAPQDSDLAAIDSKYPASHTGTQAVYIQISALPWQLSLFGFGLHFITPTERTEYYTAEPELNWETHYFALFLSGINFAGDYFSAGRSFQPGTSLSTTWAGTPAGPRLLQARSFVVGEPVCPACINGTTLNLLGSPFGDNDPMHFGVATHNGQGQSVSFGVFADNVQVAQGSASLGTSVTMPSSAQTYRIDYNTTRSSPDFQLSTAVQTSWSVPAAVPTSSLPAGWVCEAGGSTTCQVVPLITNSYDLPVNLLGQLPAGPTVGQLDLGHLASASIAFSSVQVNVSYDSGQTWQPVTVTDLGSGHFGLAFTVPAAASTDGFGALQVSVTDAAGGTFNQTIQHAFAVGS